MNPITRTQESFSGSPAYFISHESRFVLQVSGYP